MYAAMDWLLAQQKKDREETRPKRHLREGGIAMYDLSSSWVEGAQCELAAFGYSRDGKRGRMQIEYGLLTDPDGRPVGIDLFRGNTADATAFKTAVSKVREDFGLTELVFVGDRGMITKTRIADLRELEGAGWVTALKAPDIAALAADGGPLQLSLFDAQNLAEISHPDYPGRKAGVLPQPGAGRITAAEAGQPACRHRDGPGENTGVSAGGQAERQRQDRDTGRESHRQAQGRESISCGKSATPASPSRRNQDNIAAEARLDGIYVIRATIVPDTDRRGGHRENLQEPQIRRTGLQDHQDR